MVRRRLLFQIPRKHFRKNLEKKIGEKFVELGHGTFLSRKDVCFEGNSRNLSLIEKILATLGVKM